ncbi:MAG: shikimate dehydrogenase [Rhodocyclales bacterium GWA2_65_20]|nr:MAG: shikimate dehydrogenase [Rhodocyclales bacterium GWA2_65_20]
MTDRYAVFGNPVAHSKSPRIHALFSRQTGQDISYEALLAPLDGFAAAVRAFAAAGGRGANVTVPFKEEAYRIATQLTPRAQAAGAVNTLSFADHGGVIAGDNTDGAGLVRDLEANLGCDITDKRVLLLGAGGAARGAILPLLQEAPAELFIANRTAEKAARLALEFRRVLEQRQPEVAHLATGAALPEGGGFDELAGRRFDLVINATAAGLAEAALPLPPDIYAPASLAYEMLYGRETPFMAQARDSGAGRVADGLGMLVEQAAEAFFVWRQVRPATGPVLLAMRAVPPPGR